MSLLVAKAKEEVKVCVLNAAKSAVEMGILENAELAEFTVSVPQNREHGDWAVNAAMVWARAFHKAPRQIAEILAEEEITIDITMQEGDSEVTAWGCDLTYDYVKINGDYRT